MRLDRVQAMGKVQKTGMKIVQGHFDPGETLFPLRGFGHFPGFVARKFDAGTPPT